MDLSLFIMVVRFMTPILLAALGGLITDIAGVVNIGLEGMMLTSAFAAVTVGSSTGSWLIGTLAGIMASLIIALAIGLFSIKMNVDILIVGFAVNILGSGLTIFLLNSLFGVTGNYTPSTPVSIPEVTFPFLQDVPIIGRLLSGHSLMIWIALAAVALCMVLIYRTPYGVHLRCVGEAPTAAKSLGISVKRIQYSSLLWSGLFTGLAGSYMSIGLTSMFVTDMTGGTGFIALAVVLFGNRKPLGVLLGSVIFGLATAVTTIVQTSQGVQFPSQFIQMVPYLATLVVLIVFAVRKKRMVSLA
ncbi:ABC transporter permease [Paenibacillus tyrfis]|uniref:ABC transporter permease n=1 Tax=Paenibacillus tyrfis TaxID=1501230 RepID=UPI0020A0464A|nr:ABC transporter permease [Paenibacillus tyrfis]MCP1312432.1 ABC transporter permease [Paenibacillus tyrfis]